MKPGAIAAILAVLAGCGYPGPPLPPALNVPKPVADLRVEETGDRIVVRFTPPTQTTENVPVGQLQAVTLYIGLDDAEFSPERWSAARRHQVPVDAAEFSIPAADWVGQRIALSVRTTGRTGRESDFSNFQFLDVGPPLSTPASVTPKNVAEGVALTWTGNAPRYQVLRMIAGAPDARPEPIGETEQPEFLDSTTVYGARYQYIVLGIDGDARRSLPSDPVEMVPADTFPPPVPVEITAVAGPNSIDLSWLRGEGEDLAGYNIFRAMGDGPFELLAPRVPVPAYTDTTAQPGRRYRYTVSAVDTAGNESDRSAEATAQIEP